MAQYSSYEVCHHNHTYECKCYHCLCEDCFQNALMVLVIDASDDRHGESGFAGMISDEAMYVVFPNGEARWFSHSDVLDIGNSMSEDDLYA